VRTDASKKASKTKTVNPIRIGTAPIQPPETLFGEINEWSRFMRFIWFVVRLLIQWFIEWFFDGISFDWP
jgi:hypothetical protein